MATVLLTRPRAASESLARELERHGYACVIEPLLVIEPLDTLRPDSGNIRAIMITSGNALEGGGQGLKPFFSLPCFCVGRRTAEKAVAVGFSDVYTAAHDGTELARLMANTLGDSRTGAMLHISGRDIDSRAGDELLRLGHRVIGWPLYAAHPVARLMESTIDQFRQGKLDTVLIFSARTAETLRTLIARHKLEACCDGLTAIGLSETVIDVLKPLSWRKRLAAAAPTEDALIECLKQIHPVSRG